MASPTKDAFVKKLEAEIDRVLSEQGDLFMRLDQLEARLQALRDALELYTENQPGEEVKEIDALKASRSAPPKRRRVRLPKSRFGFVLERIKMAGPRGLTISEMVEQCKTAGVAIKRPSLRSQLYDHKQKGILIPRNGRYVHSSAAETAGNGQSDPSKPEAPSGRNRSDTLGASFATGLAIQ